MKTWLAPALGTASLIQLCLVHTTAVRIMFIGPPVADHSGNQADRVFLSAVESPPLPHTYDHQTTQRLCHTWIANSYLFLVPIHVYS